MKIAIDGPGGAGKSSVSKAVAAKLRIVYVDTGALYRTIGYYVRSVNADPKSAEQVTPLLDKISIEVKYVDGTQRVFLNGEDLGDKIRTPEMSMYASAVSALPIVRAFLLDMQKNLSREQSVVMDGRDIGTVIMPDADLKIFLTASNECRAMRRTEELLSKGVKVSFEEVLSDMIERDRQDKERNIAPAIPADDAIIFDNSVMSVEESLKEIVRLVNERK